MLQAHQGYFKADVQLISDKNMLIEIPPNKRITVIWEEETIETKLAETEKGKKKKAIDALTGIIPLDFEFNLDDIRLERIERRGIME